jgi:hypothetical protein
MPERWGYVQFSGMKSGAGTDAFVEDRNERVRWALRRLYYRQRRIKSVTGRYAPDLAALDAGSIQVRPGSPPARIGAQIARALYQRISNAIKGDQHD